MANARRGLYIRVGYSVFRDGIPEDLASVTALTVIFRHICQPNSSVMYTAEKLSTYANTVSATITDADQVKLASGDYKIEVYYRRANPANESGYAMDASEACSTARPRWSVCQANSKGIAQRGVPHCPRYQAERSAWAVLL